MSNIVHKIEITLDQNGALSLMTSDKLPTVLFYGMMEGAKELGAANFGLAKTMKQGPPTGIIIPKLQLQNS